MTQELRFWKTNEAYLTHEGLDWRDYASYCFFLEKFKNIPTLTSLTDEKSPFLDFCNINQLPDFELNNIA